MTPEKAYSLGARSVNMTITSLADKFRGQWVVAIPDPDRTHGHVLWTGDAFGAAQFVTAVARLEHSSN